MQTPGDDDDTADTYPTTFPSTPNQVNETIKPLEFANTVMLADVGPSVPLKFM